MDAINRELAHHYSETGAYPATLQQLGVDTTTGMCAYPRVAYRRAFTNSPFSGYQLKVETGLGLLNWDSLFFWPSQKYPKTIYGGEVEVIKTPGGVWAYVHE